MTSVKRSLADLLNAEDSPAPTDERRRTKPRLSDLLSPVNEQPPASTSTSTSTLLERKLSYPPKVAPAHPVKPTPFQQPLPLLTFSYTPSRVLEFNDSALRYFVQPPRDAQLSYGYERWVRKPDEKGRIDGLVKALDRVCSGMNNGSKINVGVVAWRGVMTRWAS